MAERRLPTDPQIRQGAFSECVQRVLSSQGMPSVDEIVFTAKGIIQDLLTTRDTKGVAQTYGLQNEMSFEALRGLSLCEAIRLIKTIPDIARRIGGDRFGDQLAQDATKMLLDNPEIIAFE